MYRKLYDKLLLTLFAAAVATGAHAQRVSDVAFEQAGDKVRITYQLDRTADIQVFLSTDGGKTYGQPLRAVSGDAGQNVAAGSKTVIWSPLDEMNEITGDHIVFKVVPAMRVSQTAPYSTAEGRLPGRFSVSPTVQVRFARGNLQYQESTGTWRFAGCQYECLGDGNRNTSSSGGWTDLFGLGAEGKTAGKDKKKSGRKNSGPSAFPDWGANPVSNGGNAPDQWRTLTRDEWMFLFKSRPDAGGKYGAAKVNGMAGVVVLPDEWTLPDSCSFYAGMAGAGADTDWSGARNVYTAARWRQMEANGAVFLPAAGFRMGKSVGLAGSYGFYWSSTPMGKSNAYYVYITSLGVEINASLIKNNGRSVRLAQTVQD